MYVFVVFLGERPVKVTLKEEDALAYYFNRKKEDRPKYSIKRFRENGKAVSLPTK